MRQRPVRGPDRIEPHSSLPWRPFVPNLCLLLLLGVGSSAWVLHYTDWFPAVGGILALGGAFSWLAFVSKLLPEERLRGMQQWADSALLGRRRTLVGLAVAAIGFFALANCLGTLQVESLYGATDRGLQVRGVAGRPARDVQLPAGARVRIPLFTSWWRESRWRAKVSGYPELEVEMRPWRRLRLLVPGSFTRPVVLLRPSPRLFERVHNNPVTLLVRLDGREYRTQFDGSAFWVGNDEDLDVPPRLEQEWRAELEAEHRPAWIYSWLRPKALAADPIALSPGSSLHVELLNPDDRDFSRLDYTVHAPQERDDFAQEVELDVQQ